jgi:hypothetical protein
MTRKVAVPAAVLVATLLMPFGASAATSICPDHMGPTFVIVNPDYAKKDRNNNLIVCVKDTDGGVKGGPDDKAPSITDDIVL